MTERVIECTGPVKRYGEIEAVRPSPPVLSAPLAHAESLETRGATVRAVFIISYRDVLRLTRDRPRIAISLA